MWRLIPGLDNPLVTGDWSFAARTETGARRWLARDEDHAGATHILVVVCGIRILLLAPERWQWDGSVEAPTLEPSILCRLDGVEVWHGWLRAGQLVPADALN